MFPERLPQSWSAVSYGARGFAYDWWRTYEDELVTVPMHAICAALGVPPRSRRHVQAWLTELIDFGAIKRQPDGLQMLPIIRRKSGQDDAQSTPSERSDDAQTTLSERPVDPQSTPSERSSEANCAKSIGADFVSESGYTDRQRERSGFSYVEGGMEARASSALLKLQAVAGSQGEVSFEAAPSRSNWAARYATDRADREVAAFDRVTGTRRDC